MTFATLLKAGYAIGGIYICFMYYAFRQEAIFSTRFSPDDAKFKSTIFLILCQSTVATVLYGTIMLLKGNTRKSGAPWYSFFLMSCSQSTASFGSNNALKYVNYPTQVIMKSCKMVPVMIMGVVIAKKRYSIRQYLCVLTLSAGIALFTMGKSKHGAGGGSFTDPRGIALCLLSLFMDGLTGGYQEKVVHTHKPNSLELGFYMNAAGVPLLTIACLVTGELQSGLDFAMNHPQFLQDVTIFSVVFVAGQHFVFFALANFGSLVCTIITTTRKFFTLLFSVFWFRHALTSTQWAGASLVFCAAMLEVSEKWQKQRAASKEASAQERRGPKVRVPEASAPAPAKGRVAIEGKKES
eukprot:tig00000411_g534.t1